MPRSSTGVVLGSLVTSLGCAGVASAASVTFEAVVYANDNGFGITGSDTNEFVGRTATGKIEWDEDAEGALSPGGLSYSYPTPGVTFYIKIDGVGEFVSRGAWEWTARVLDFDMLGYDKLEFNGRVDSDVFVNDDPLGGQANISFGLEESVFNRDFSTLPDGLDPEDVRVAADRFTGSEIAIWDEYDIEAVPQADGIHMRITAIGGDGGPTPVIPTPAAAGLGLALIAGAASRRTRG